MARFRFSLQPALDVAVSREREAGVASGRARGRVDEARAALAMLDVRAGELSQSTRALHALAIPASQWIASEFFAERLRDVRARRDRAFFAADAANRDARTVLERARSRRIALERLREKRLADHRFLQEQREASELDESNAASAARRGSVRPVREG